MVWFKAVLIMSNSNTPTTTKNTSNLLVVSITISYWTGEKKTFKRSWVVCVHATRNQNLADDKNEIRYEKYTAKYRLLTD